MNRQEIERLIHAEVQRRVEKEVRLAKNNPQHDVVFGILDDELVHGGTATLNVHHYSLSNATWEDSGKTVEVHDFFLASGETWPASTRVRAKYYVTVWVIDQAACSPDSGGGGGGTGSGSSSPATLGAGSGADMDGDFYPGGLDYGNSFDGYGQFSNYDDLIGV